MKKSKFKVKQAELDMMDLKKKHPKAHPYSLVQGKYCTY